MYTGQNWDATNPTESQVYSYDFVNDLASGETLTGLPTFTLTVFQGVDATPSSRLSGSAGINGSICSQRVAGLLGNVTYTLTCTVSTSLSNTLTLFSHIPCQSIV